MVTVGFDLIAMRKNGFEISEVVEKYSSVNLPRQYVRAFEVLLADVTVVLLLIVLVSLSFR